MSSLSPVARRTRTSGWRLVSNSAPRFLETQPRPNNSGRICSKERVSSSCWTNWLSISSTRRQKGRRKKANVFPPGFSSIDGIDLDEELRTPNKTRGTSVLRSMMNQAKRTAVDFLVPLGLEEHLRHSPDGASAYQFWRALAPEEKFLLKALELEAAGVEKIGAFQDLGRAYGIADYEALLGPAKANEARTKLPAEV